MNGEPKNAVAGPSNLRTTYLVSAPSLVSTPTTTDPHATLNTLKPLSSLPLYLSPPAPPPPKQHLASTQDLILRLQLLPAYDKYVRPHIVSQGTTNLPDASSSSNLNLDGVNTAMNTPTASGLVLLGHVDKGKGREVPIPEGDVEMQDGHDGDDEEGKGEKKKKNNYKHLIKGIAGKHSMKKDDYLTTIMHVPPKQRLKIRRFDEKTQEDAFTVSLEGLKSWNINTLVVESAQAREDRKKRKEAKRAAKFQVQGLQPLSSITVPSMAIAQPQPQAASRPVATPKPAVAIPTTGNASSAARTAITVPRPGSTAPRPGYSVPKPTTQTQAQTGTPVLARRATPMEVDQHRGKKREREDSVSVANNTHVNGGGMPAVTNVYVNGANSISNAIQQQQRPSVAVALNAKAGTGSIRPRPIKKQRMDIQGQARDVNASVQQQPTPQGV